MHKELIEKIIESGSPRDMKCLEKMLVSMIDDLKISDKDEYKAVEYKLYNMVYGDHLSEDIAKTWVSRMDNKDGSKGEHWSIDQTSQYAENRDKYDFYAVLNMMYSDYFNPRFDNSVYVQMAKDWIDDEDVPQGKTLKYYMYIVNPD